MSINFWWKSLNKWVDVVSLFPKFWNMLILVSSDEIGQRFMYKICIIRNNNDVIWVYIGQQGVLLFHFPTNSCGSSILDSTAWNCTKFCMKYTYFERWYNFWDHSLLGSTVVTIFPEFLQKCRFCVLLNETAQNSYARCIL